MRIGFKAFEIGSVKRESFFSVKSRMKNARRSGVADPSDGAVKEGTDPTPTYGYGVVG